MIISFDEQQFTRFRNVISGIPQGSVPGPLFFIIFTSDMGNDLENKIISYADDTTLYAPIFSPTDRDLVAASLNRDLSKIVTWCHVWGMRLNAKKTNSIIISRSRTLFPPHPDLYILDDRLQNVEFLKLLGVTLDPQLTFEKTHSIHLVVYCTKIGSASQML